jgi:hypothetical protein
MAETTSPPPGDCYALRGASLVALPDDSDVLAWVEYLARAHDADLPHLRERNHLYEGTARLHYLHPDLLREVEDRIQVVALGWPSLAVDPLEERLDVLGFRYPEDGDVGPDAKPEDLVSASGDENLQKVWQENDLDEESQLGHVDALVMRRAYATVGVQDDGSTDVPLVTVESPLEMFALIDPRTRQVRAALRRWTEEYDLLKATMPAEYATLYLPNLTAWFDRGPNGWRETDRDEHNVGEPLVAALTNRARLADRYGRSELTPALLSLSHAANKMATDMMVAGEFHMVPLRALFGVGPDDFKDTQGTRLSGLQIIMSRLLTVPPATGAEPVTAHEFSASSLDNFHETIATLGRLAAGLIGVDPSVMGFTAGDNPASADALRAREVRLVKRAERKQTAFGGGWERAMRLVRRIQEGDADPAARRLETIWRDAATPTRAQAADAAVKLLTAKAIPVQQAREDLGYTPEQQRRMDAWDKANEQANPMAEIARGLADQRLPAPADPGAAPVDPVPASVG